MPSSLENINPEYLKGFLKHISIINNEIKSRRQAHHELRRQIDKVKAAPKKWIRDKEVKELQNKVNDVIEKEKNLLRYEDDKKTIDRLLDKIKLLESELAVVKRQRDEAISENEKEILALRKSLSSIRSRMSAFIKAKEERDKRLRYLEQKIQKVTS